MPITFKPQGRFGNLMFQAAATIALALENNDEYIIPICELKNTTNIPINKFSNVSFKNNYKEPFFHYSKIPYKKDICIEGYFQSYKYFNKFNSKIKEILSPSVKYTGKTNHTSIHIRRNDYLKFPNHHPVLGMDYYNKAINFLPSNKYLIFSDDIEWCKKSFIGDKFEFVEGNLPHIDMALMLSCKNNIIANSSFSWWGAWLNNNKDKTVIAPKKWFGPALNYSTKDLFPYDWVIM